VAFRDLLPASCREVAFRAVEVEVEVEVEGALAGEEEEEEIHPIAAPNAVPPSRSAKPARARV